MLRLMVMRALACAAALGLALVGCSGEPQRLCTLIGGADATHVLFPAAALEGLAGPLEAEVCAGRACARSPVVPGGQAVLNDDTDFMESEPTSFRVRLYASGAVVRMATADVTPLTYAPNGPDCGPRYSLATLALGDDVTSLEAVEPSALGLSPRLVG